MVNTFCSVKSMRPVDFRLMQNLHLVNFVITNRICSRPLARKMLCIRIVALVSGERDEALSGKVQPGDHHAGSKQEAGRENRHR